MNAESLIGDGALPEPEKGRVDFRWRKTPTGRAAVLGQQNTFTSFAEVGAELRVSQTDSKLQREIEQTDVECVDISAKRNHDFGGQGVGERDARGGESPTTSRNFCSEIGSGFHWKVEVGEF
jgi:hypothetical protein